MAEAVLSSSEILKCGDKQRVCQELARICIAVNEEEEEVVRLGQDGIHTTLLELIMSEDEDVSEAAAQAIDACVQNCPHGVSFPTNARQLDDSSANPFIMVDLGDAEPDTEAHSSRSGHGGALSGTQGFEGSSKSGPSRSGSQAIEGGFRDSYSEALSTGNTDLPSCSQPSPETLHHIGARPAPDNLAESSDTAQKEKGHATTSCSIPLSASLPSSIPHSSGPESLLKSEAMQIKLRKVRERQDGHKRIGNMLWASAISLSRWIVRNRWAAINGKDVLEVGSGLGLCGIVAGRYARSVVLTDFDPVIVKNLEYNICCNRHVLRKGGRFCSARALDWYNLPAGPFGSSEGQTPAQVLQNNESRSGGPAASSSQANAHSPTSLKNDIIQPNGFGGDRAHASSNHDTERTLNFSSEKAFDVIVGSDVVHEEAMADGIVAVLRRFLALDGVAIIVNPHSHHREGVDRFRELLFENGFCFEVMPIEREHVDGEPTPNCTVQPERLVQQFPQVKERPSEAQESDVLARFEDELKDITLERYVISRANNRTA